MHVAEKIQHSHLHLRAFDAYRPYEFAAEFVRHAAENMLHASTHFGPLLVFSLLVRRQFLALLALELHPRLDLALAQQLLRIFGTIGRIRIERLVSLPRTGQFLHHRDVAVARRGRHIALNQFVFDIHAGVILVAEDVLGAFLCPTRIDILLAQLRGRFVLLPFFRRFAFLDGLILGTGVALNRRQNRIHKLLDRWGIQIGGILADIFGLNGRRILTGLRDGKSTEEIMRTLTDHVASKFELIRDALTKSLDEEDRYLLGELIEMRDEETRHIERALDRLKEQATPWQRNLDLLQTIPGIDDQSAADLLSEMGADLDVFGSPSRFAAWAGGECPGDNESAGKRRPAKARKGSAHMRTLLVNCAHAAARTKDSQYHGFHRTHTHRLGCKRAIVATAHKLARTIYVVLRDQKPYEDPHVDYEEIMVRRNAPRWIQALEKYNIEYLGTTSKRS